MSKDPVFKALKIPISCAADTIMLFMDNDRLTAR